MRDLPLDEQRPPPPAALATAFSCSAFYACIIRAKRVSNCYMQEKKTDRLCVCLS